MAEPCDPEVLHARLSVVENDSKRYNQDISQLWSKVSALEICAASLPGINESLKAITTKVENLTSCALKHDGQTIAYLSIREWLLVVMAIVALLLQHFTNFSLNK